MPAVSPEQYGAMQAAAHGKGRRGIPASVAREYIKATPAEKRAAYAKALRRR